MRHDDSVADALALIECRHRGDPEGAMAVLRHCDAQMVAATLAKIACDVIEDWLGDEGDVFARLREHYT